MQRMGFDFIYLPYSIGRTFKRNNAAREQSLARALRAHTHAPICPRNRNELCIKQSSDDTDHLPATYLCLPSTTTAN